MFQCLKRSVNPSSFVFREKAPAGTPLLQVIDTGIERLKLSTDCLNVVMKELREHANRGNVKLATFMDGVNCLFGDQTYVLKENMRFKHGYLGKIWIEKLLHPNELNALRNMKKMLR